MKLEAIKRQAGRPGKNSAQVGQNFDGKSSRAQIAESSPDSSSQIQRYIRLNELEPELLQLVDEGKIGMTPAVEISYDEATIRAIIKGQRTHQPKKYRKVWESHRPQTIIDIQAKLAAGKGEAYRRWATVENLKRMAKTKLYMDEHGFSYEAMTERKAELSAKEKELSAKITEAQTRLAEINVLKTHIVNYSKTRDVYVAYRKSGYSKKFLEEHEADIIIR